MPKGTVGESFEKMRYSPFNKRSRSDKTGPKKKEGSKEKLERIGYNDGISWMELVNVSYEHESYRLPLDDMVPETATDKRLEQVLPIKSWDLLRRLAYRRRFEKNSRCEVCKGLISTRKDRRAMVHEHWKLEPVRDQTKPCKMKFQKLYALCEVCYAALNPDLGEELLLPLSTRRIALHLARLNCWDYQSAKKYYLDMLALKVDRESREWVATVPDQVLEFLKAHWRKHNTPDEIEQLEQTWQEHYGKGNQ